MVRRVPVVLAPGEVSQRGDVVDLFPLGSKQAVRLEFFDDEIESIRQFDPASQRSLARVSLQRGSPPTRAATTTACTTRKAHPASSSIGAA